MDNDFRLVFRKIAKKDLLTKQKVCFDHLILIIISKLIQIEKGLEEFKALLDTKTLDECVSIISYWSKLYTKLSIVSFIW